MGSVRAGPPLPARPACARGCSGAGRAPGRAGVTAQPASPRAGSRVSGREEEERLPHPRGKGEGSGMAGDQGWRGTAPSPATQPLGGLWGRLCVHPSPMRHPQHLRPGTSAPSPWLRHVSHCPSADNPPAMINPARQPLRPWPHPGGERGCRSHGWAPSRPGTARCCHAWAALGSAAPGSGCGRKGSRMWPVMAIAEGTLRKANRETRAGARG